MKLPLSLLCLCLAIPLSPNLAWAETDPNALIDEGVELRRKGRDSEALEKFSEAYQLSQSPRALAQVALAEQALGLWPQAQRHLQDALSNADDPWITTNRKVLEESLSTVRDHVGSLDIRCNVPNASVRLNGKDLGKLPFSEPLLVVSGSGVLEVQAAGHRPLVRAIHVIPRELTRETVELVPEVTPSVAVGTPASPDPATTVRTSAGASNLEITAWITGGVGILALGGGVAAYFIRQDQAKKWNDDSRCLIDGRTRRENCAKNADNVKSAETMMAVGFIAGGLLGATSATLFALSPSSDSTVPEAASGSTNTRSSVRLLSCGSGPGTLGLACAGQF